MKCPVCGDDCVSDAFEIINGMETIFAPCPRCRGRTLEKKSIPPDYQIPDPCICGKRFIDDVYAAIYKIGVEEGDLAGSESLKDVGIPLIHPGMVLEEPPYLPPRSLVLLTDQFTEETARRIVDSVPEVRGVVRDNHITPGLVDPDTMETPQTHTLLAGCDVRANIFATQVGPIVTYKQASTMHIEFPRPINPKIISVDRQIFKRHPKVFVDACSGPGTLGIAAGRLGVQRLIFNDAWYAAAFWTAFNLRVNHAYLGIDDVEIFESYQAMAETPVRTDPHLVAIARGSVSAEVYQGDYRLLSPHLPDTDLLTVIDLFDKGSREMVDSVISDWKAKNHGDVFIP
ncbi:MAG: hypothetical protein D5R99_05100 [Methanocalculus sp. MSAO_Arc1]|uniref:hypothetical protein n=1 Tax=Methanocalculus TaxID=71151 RepID=UPI000FF51AE1|nr:MULTISPECIES: hypothetical protein [unclassified Methanocalculus]MCP1662911.1 hypothetical protein [Methanocalculus sp. AMF5]RQD80385.1 MAG: hypothetical protein D5R99_05100 [Methanocalculus sp. MSAO_Arc1]